MMSKFDELADELLLQIYAYLPERSRIALSLACKNLRRVGTGLIPKVLVIDDFLGSNGDKQAYAQKYALFTGNIGGITKTFTSLKIRRGGSNLAAKEHSCVENDHTFGVFQEVSDHLDTNQLETIVVRIGMENDTMMRSLLAKQKSIRACSIVVAGISVAHSIYPALSECPNLISLAVESENEHISSSLTQYAQCDLLGPLRHQLHSLKIATKSITLTLSDLQVLFDMPNLTQLALTTTAKTSAFNDWGEGQNRPIERPGRRLTYLRLNYSDAQHQTFFFRHIDLRSMKHVHLTITTNNPDILSFLRARCWKLESLSIRVNCSKFFKDATGVGGSWGGPYSLKRLWINMPIPKSAWWWDEAIKDILMSCENLVELGLPLDWYWQRGKDTSYFKWDIPEETNNLQCFHILTDLESVEISKPENVDKVTTEMLVDQFLWESKIIYWWPESHDDVPDDDDIYDSDGEYKCYDKCRFPKIRALCIGTYRLGELDGKTVQLKPETWEVVHYSNGDGGRKLEHGDFFAKYPEFYGWKYDDEDDIWSDSRGRFWE